jgi:cyclase
MNPADTDAVAGIFAESDDGPLPHMLGVSARSLFAFHGLYLHLIEAGQAISPALAQIREQPSFVDVNTKLAAHISPFDPPTWRTPADAMAHQFYRWTSDRS